MTPYLWLQAAYFGVAFTLAGGSWWLVAHLRPGIATRQRLRLIAAAGLMGALALAWIVATRLIHGHSTYEFALIAFVFYALTFHFPLIVFASLWRARRSGGRFDGLLAATVLAMSACGLWALFVEPNRLQVVERRFEVTAWPSASKPVRLVHLSDLQTVGDCARQDRVVELVRELQPDLIVLTGDYVAGPFWNTGPAVASARKFLGALRAPLGVYAVPGHSETEAIRREVFLGLDVRYLVNEEVVLDLGDGRRLEIFGLSTHGEGLHQIRPEHEPALLRIVLSHVPDVSRDLEGRGVDLHLAGHTHGGQVCVPGWGAIEMLSSLGREYARGMHRFGDHWLQVSPGIGMEGNHAPRIRFFCPPEVIVLDLVGGQGSP